MICVYCFQLSSLTRGALQVAPDQAGHLDAWIHGLIVLLNVMKDKAYFGTYLKSGGCVLFLKALVRKDFKPFESAFKDARSPDGRLLFNAMCGDNFDQKLDMA